MNLFYEKKNLNVNKAFKIESISIEVWMIKEIQKDQKYKKSLIE